MADSARRAAYVPLLIGLSLALHGACGGAGSAAPHAQDQPGDGPVDAAVPPPPPKRVAEPSEEAADAAPDAGDAGPNEDAGQSAATPKPARVIIPGQSIVERPRELLQATHGPACSAAATAPARQP